MYAQQNAQRPNNLILGKDLPKNVWGKKKVGEGISGR